MNWRSLVAEYMRSTFPHVAGWVDRSLVPAVIAIQQIHDELTVRGNIAEIGVHHGKFFFLLNCLRREAETGYAMDIFGEQALNVDRSGCGDYARFLQAAERAGCDMSSIEVESADSLICGRSWKAHSLRLCSIDGGHTVIHTRRDLETAEARMVNGGIVFLDDYHNHKFPGVHEGFIRYMNGSALLAPVAYYANKLLLTPVSMHDAVVDRFGTLMSAHPQIQMKEVTLCGFRSFAMRWVPCGV